MQCNPCNDTCCASHRRRNFGCSRKIACKADACDSRTTQTLQHGCALHLIRQSGDAVGEKQAQFLRLHQASKQMSWIGSLAIQLFVQIACASTQRSQKWQSLHKSALLQQLLLGCGGFSRAGTCHTSSCSCNCGVSESICWDESGLPGFLGSFSMCTSRKISRNIWQS